jgi:hypothetical protein
MSEVFYFLEIKKIIIFITEIIRLVAFTYRRIVI